MKLDVMSAAALAVAGVAVVAYFKSTKAAPAPAAPAPLAASLAMQSWDNAPTDPIFSSAAAAALTTAQAAPDNTAHLFNWGIANGGSW